MPIYAYECKKCGAKEEHIQKMSDPPMSKCETCGGKLQKLMTAAAFHLKGGGWYADGYGSTKPEGESKSSESKSSDSKSSDSKSSDSKSSSDTPAKSKKKASKAKSTGSKKKAKSKD